MIIRNVCTPAKLFSKKKDKPSVYNCSFSTLSTVHITHYNWFLYNQFLRGCLSPVLFLSAVFFALCQFSESSKSAHNERQDGACPNIWGFEMSFLGFFYVSIPKECQKRSQLSYNNIMQTDHYINLLYPEQMDQKLHGLLKSLRLGYMVWNTIAHPNYHLTLYVLYVVPAKNKTWNMIIKSHNYSL